MATKTRKTTTKKSARKARQTSLEWNLDDFAPEWASEGIERVTNAIDEFSDELQSRADEIQSRGEKLRKDTEKRFEKRVKNIQAELRKQPAVKRAEQLRKDVEKNVDAASDRVLSSLGLASTGEIKKLERKIAQLNKKLRTLEKAQAA